VTPFAPLVNHRRTQLPSGRPESFRGCASRARHRHFLLRVPPSLAVERWRFFHDCAGVLRSQSCARVRNLQGLSRGVTLRNQRRGPRRRAATRATSPAPTRAECPLPECAGPDASRKRTLYSPGALPGIGSGLARVFPGAQEEAYPRPFLRREQELPSAPGFSDGWRSTCRLEGNSRVA
jgi:hypothetical protein